MPEKIETALDQAMSAFLTQYSALEGEDRAIFARVVADLTAALREGHICIVPDGNGRKVVSMSRVAAEDGSKPLVLSGKRLYLARYFKYERDLSRRLTNLSSITHDEDDIEEILDICFPRNSEEDIDWQREAAGMALRKGLSIISGGPGTGKTTTVVRIVGLLLKKYGVQLKVALAAPTGKAAMRLRESITAHRDELPLDEEILEAFPKEAVTLHRLLGSRRYSTRFRHDRNHPMVWDVVLIDEASMVDLALMSKLVEALKEGARLIMLGDMNQLSSVESGSVLADCVAALPENVIELKKTYRFDQGIAGLAGALNRGEDNKVWDLLENGSFDSVSKAGCDWLEKAAEKYDRYMNRVFRTKPEYYTELFSLFGAFRVLCGLRQGRRGVSGVNQLIENHLVKLGHPCRGREWYTGRPVIITRNDYNLGLYNGDIGICLPDPDRDGEPAVWFEHEGGLLRRYLPVRLPACETVWAMTIHKSQGSEFEEVMIVLPEKDNRLLCRELIYTAVTRARKQVTILSDEDVCRAAVKRQTERCSGLIERLCGTGYP